jgi:dUTP pyrophosphatase
MSAAGPASAVTVVVKRLPHAEGLPVPRYETDGAAGLDLVAAVPADQACIIAPGRRALVPTGLILQLPVGYEGQVRPRSGLALRHGLTVLNAPGTIDSDYRGEIGLILVNLGELPVTITRGMRVAQLVVAPVTRVAIGVVESVDDSGRGAGGFGSTGL